MQVKKTLYYGVIFIGVFLFGLNGYGLFCDIRPNNLGLFDEDLRFAGDISIGYEDFEAQLAELKALPPSKAIVKTVTQLVSKSLTHLDWERVDPVEYHQLVPAWENFILYLMGRFSGLEYYERYHYTNFHRSVERGIGICGDASMVLSQVLDQLGISNRVVAFPDHVVVSVDDPSFNVVADPDYGVVMDYNLDKLVSDPQLAYGSYLASGYSAAEALGITRIYMKKHNIVFESAFLFVPKRFIFESMSYILKWLIPMAFITIGLFGLKGVPVKKY